MVDDEVGFGGGSGVNGDVVCNYKTEMCNYHDIKEEKLVTSNKKWGKKKSGCLLHM